MKDSLLKIFVASCIITSCTSKTDSKNEDSTGAIQKIQIDLSESCNYSGHTGNDEDIKEFYTFKSDDEAIRAMSKIMRHTGLPANFELIATDVDNAAAVIRESKRYILYGQTFMEDVKTKTKSDFGSLSILAHEIGHHLSGHTLLEGGSRPVLELEADRFSGFILAKLGASIDEACTAINIYGSENETFTHPSKKSRIAAIINGWKEGNESNAVKQEQETVSPEYEKKKSLSTRPEVTLPLETEFYHLKKSELQIQVLPKPNRQTSKQKLLNLIMEIKSRCSAQLELHFISRQRWMEKQLKDIL